MCMLVGPESNDGLAKQAAEVLLAESRAGEEKRAIAIDLGESCAEARVLEAGAPILLVAENDLIL